MTAADATGAAPENPYWVKRSGLLGGVLLAIALQLFPVPDGLTPEAWMLASLALMMAVWWATEAIPIAATALVPLALFPFFGIADAREAATPYASPTVMLLLGGFIIALGIERWNLHTRIALNIVARFGTHPAALMLGFMVAGAILSMWISNTATTLMMIPIAMKVAEAEQGEGMDMRIFAPALALSIAYACSIGGMATPVGTPTNLIGLAYLESQFGTTVSFVEWMSVGLPCVIVLIPLVWLVLTRFVFKVRRQVKGGDGGHAAIAERLKALGSMTAPERRVAAAFGTVAILWIGRDLPGGIGWNPLLAWLSESLGLGITLALGNAQIAIMGALAMFLIPAGSIEDRRAMLMDWPTAARVPWNVVLLLGGGLSLAAAIQASGLAEWIGIYLAGIADLPLPLIVLIVCLIVVFLTEFTSNVATVSAFLPVLGALAAQVGVPPEYLVVPVALAASCAFMLPVATAPNAIAFASGHVAMPQMIRAGFRLNLIAAPIIALLASLIAPRVLG